MRAAALLPILVLAACGAGMSPTPAPHRPPAAAPTPETTKTPDAPSPAPTRIEPPHLPVPERAPARLPIVLIVLTRPVAAGRAHVSVKGAWTLVSADGPTLASGTGLDAVLLLGGSSTTLGPTPFPAGALLRPALDGDLHVDARSYSGALEVDRGPDGRMRPMIATDVESYVAAVVNSEIPAAFPREAQRTQAIVARTYALTSTVRTSPDAPLVLADVGVTDQEFAGLAPVAEHRRIGADAAQSTRGLVLTDDGAPFVAYYHSTCGGTTCPGTIVFGRTGAGRALAGGVACPWCTSSKYYRWDAKIAGATVAKAAGLTGSLESFAVAETTSGGRAVDFDVRVGGKTKRVRATDLRRGVGTSAMRSVLIEDAAVVGGDLIVHGRGWGHGVGLCQMGAKTLAGEGRTAEAILAVYYPGSALEKRW